MDNFIEQEGMEEGAVRAIGFLGACGLLIVLGLAVALFVIIL